LSKRTLLRALPFGLFWFLVLALGGVLGGFKAVVQVLPWITIGVISTYLIVRPNTFDFSWGRCLAAALCQVPAIESQLQLSNLAFLNLLWMVTVVFILLVAALVCIAANVGRTARFSRKPRQRLLN
jgi:hypothetical protein